MKGQPANALEVTMLLLIDNYDSFTYNLVHYLGELGAEMVVRRNDALDVQSAMALHPAAIVLSPGPKAPAQAGICLALTQAAAETRTRQMGRALKSVEALPEARTLQLLPGVPQDDEPPEAPHA